MPTANPAASPAGSLLERLEQTAWRVPLPTRRLFLTLAVLSAVALAASGLAAGWVANRNANTIDDAREQGLELATAVTEFRTNLASADATAAATLISGGLESTDSRAQYDRDLLEASAALTRAALVARPEDRADIEAMAGGELTPSGEFESDETGGPGGLVGYAGLVETARANTRLGYPVGAAYLDQARDLAQNDLFPRAERLRVEGERRIAQSVNDVGGGLSVLAIVLLFAAALVLAACAAVVAGRTRRIVAHPALVASLVAIVAAVGVMVVGILNQGSELREAASEDIDDFFAATDWSSDLSDLRVTEISALAARGSGGPIFDTFDTEAVDLVDAVGARAGETGDASMAELEGRIDEYVRTVQEGVRPLDDDGENRAASDLALSIEPGGSAGAYDLAATGPKAENEAGVLAPPVPPDADSAAGLVERETTALEDRFDAASDAGVNPVVPVALGLLAAGLAVAGTLARGRRYR